MDKTEVVASEEDLPSSQEEWLTTIMKEDINRILMQSETTTTLLNKEVKANIKQCPQQIE